MEQQIVRISVAALQAGTGEPPALVDLTIDLPLDMYPHVVFPDILQWSLENDVSPQPTLTAEKLNAVAPVQVFRGAMITCESDDRSCVICCEDFKPRKHVRKLPCGHMFCNKCIAKWVVKQNASCPTCRAAITE